MSDDEAIWKPTSLEEQLLEREAEADALRAHIAGVNQRRDQRTAALFCLAGVLGVASAGPPVLLLLAFVAAGAGIVSWVGRK